MTAFAEGSTVSALPSPFSAFASESSPVRSAVRLAIVEGLIVRKRLGERENVNRARHPRHAPGRPA